MFKRLLTSTSVRLIVILLFFGVCAGLTWSDTVHSDRYTHIEKRTDGSFDLEERVVKALCPAITDAEPSLHYAPLVTSRCACEQDRPHPVVSFIPTSSRAPPA